MVCKNIAITLFSFVATMSSYTATAADNTASYRIVEAKIPDYYYGEYYDRRIFREGETSKGMYLWPLKRDKSGRICLEARNNIPLEFRIEVLEPQEEIVIGGGAFSYECQECTQDEREKVISAINGLSSLMRTSIRSINFRNISPGIYSVNSGGFLGTRETQSIMEEKNLRVSGSFDLHSLDSTNSKIASIPANFNISAFNGLAQIQQLKVEFDMSDEDGFLRGIKLTNKSDYDMYPLRVVTVVHCKNDSDTDLYIAHDQFDRSSDLSNKTSVVVPLIQPEGSVYFDRASLRNNLIKKGCSESSEAKLLEFKAQETNPSLFGRTVFEWFDVPGGEISIW